MKKMVMKMYNLNRYNIRHHQMKSEVYIASKQPYTTEDDYGNEIVTYDNPKKFYFNVQPVSVNSANSDVQSFGERTIDIRVAIITQKEYIQSQIKEFDLAYLEGVTPKGEIKNGFNANYRVYAVQPQNAIVKVYFEKLVKNN